MGVDSHLAHHLRQRAPYVRHVHHLGARCSAGKGRGAGGHGVRFCAACVLVWLLRIPHVFRIVVHTYVTLLYLTDRYHTI